MAGCKIFMNEFLINGNYQMAFGTHKQFTEETALRNL